MLANTFSRAAACFFCAAIIFALIAATSASALAQSIAITSAALFAVTYLLGSLQVRPSPVPVRISRRRRDFAE
jgi:hypothetical protein